VYLAKLENSRVISHCLTNQNTYFFCVVTWFFCRIDWPIMSVLIAISHVVNQRTAAVEFHSVMYTEATLVALWLKPIKVLSLIGQKTKEHFWIHFNCPWFSDLHCNKTLEWVNKINLHTSTRFYLKIFNKFFLKVFSVNRHWYICIEFCYSWTWHLSSVFSNVSICEIKLKKKTIIVILKNRIILSWLIG